MSRREKREIISFIIELMREEMPSSKIREKLVSKFKITNEEAEGYIKDAFETVSFLEKNTQLSPEEKKIVFIGGLIITIVLSILYALPIIYSGYNLVILIVLYAFLISKFIYLTARRRIGTFLQMISALFTALCYFAGEFIIYIQGLRKEILMRGIEIDNYLIFIIKGIKPFIIKYMATKGLSEYILVICAVLLSISYFTSPSLKRIRE